MHLRKVMLDLGFETAVGECRILLTLFLLFQFEAEVEVVVVELQKVVALYKTLHFSSTLILFFLPRHPSEYWLQTIAALC